MFSGHLLYIPCGIMQERDKIITQIKAVSRDATEKYVNIVVFKRYMQA